MTGERIDGVRLLVDHINKDGESDTTSLVLAINEGPDAGPSIEIHDNENRVWWVPLADFRRALAFEEGR